MDHAEPLRRQQAVVGDGEGRHGGRARPARDQGADRDVRFAGRQHHAAAAGLQLGRRRLRQHRGDQGPRAGDRRPDARGSRPPGHLRLRQGREEGRNADRFGAQVDRGAATGPVRDADRGEEETPASKTGLRGQPRRAASGRRRRAPESLQTRRREALRGGQASSRSSTSAPTSSSGARWSRRFANEYGAKLSRVFHPLRFQRWAFSDLNPLLGGWRRPRRR